MIQSNNFEKHLVNLSKDIKSRFYGKYRGLVQDVSDPEDLGRIVAKVPEIFGEENTPWALPCVPFAGPKYGFFIRPKVNDGVWIEFEGGDLSRPIWTGFWWAKDEVPEDGTENNRLIITPNGHKISMDDENNVLTLLHSNGPEITLMEEEIAIKNDTIQIILSTDEVNINDGVLVIK
jgi:hypothetical protein